MQRFGSVLFLSGTMFFRSVLIVLLTGFVWFATPAPSAMAEGLSYSSDELFNDCKDLMEVKSIKRDGKAELEPSYIRKRIAGLKCSHYIGGFFDGMISLAIQTDKNMAACLANNFSTYALISAFVAYMETHPEQGKLKPYVILSGALRSVKCD